MTRHFHDAQGQVQAGHGKTGAFVERDRDGSNAVMARAQHRHMGMGQQRRNAANMVSMVVGE